MKRFWRWLKRKLLDDVVEYEMERRRISDELWI